MAVYVDNERIAWKGRQWCHLVADTLAELHSFASLLGLKRTWYQDRASYPHYDVTVSVRAKALRLGALPADKALLIACCKKLKAEAMVSQTLSAASLARAPSDLSTWTELSSSALL